MGRGFPADSQVVGYAMLAVLLRACRGFPADSQVVGSLMRSMQ